MKTGRRTFYILLQLFGALIWGLGFAFQSIGMENTGPFTFNSVRFMLATVVVFFFSVFTDLGKKRALKKSGEAPDPAKLKEHSWKNAGLWKTGIVIGILLSLAGNLQQVGILFTDSVGKAGFITAMYIILVPVCGIFMKKKIRPVMWLGVAVSVAGLYFLTIGEALTFSKGDLYLLACAVMFTVQILVIDAGSQVYDNIKLACIEFLTVSVTSGIVMFATEQPDIPSILAATVPIVYAGVFSGGMGYTIQIICQSRIEPTTASILMSCEALFCVLGGYVILHQRLTEREIIGSVLMFAAIMIVQIFPSKEKSKSGN
ncbi:MAG: DMT family transporter [Lachnospiraceae bacterium]|nr:DMT family transporter [Lachnospiraceae bacterium]